jgi:hypothetical protein
MNSSAVTSGITPPWPNARPAKEIQGDRREPEPLSKARQDREQQHDAAELDEEERPLHGSIRA